MTATEQPTRVVHEDGSAVELSEFVDVLLDRMEIRFATKDDIAAIQEDLANFATKDDITAVRAEMAENHSDLTGKYVRLQKDVDGLTEQVGNVETRLTNIEVLLKRVLRRLPPP